MSAIARDRLPGLVPHAGAMCLLEEVAEYSADHIVCTSATHRDPAHPLRQGEHLAALHLVEYAAQAMAVHGALVGDGTARPGMLAALRDVRFHTGQIGGIESALTITARRRVIQADGSLYDFEVHAGERLLCEGRIAIALQ